MTGDGVNDVLALEAADLGVAMGTGTAAARAAADLVLLDDAFAALPHVVAEGRRVLANIERVSMLFVTKTVYATLLALAIGFARWPFPFLPRHLTLVSALTIGIPGFVLALEPNSRRARPGFVVRTLRFAAPAGFVAAAATFAAYALTGVEGGSLPRARTVATIALCAVALEVLALLARPVSAARGGLVVAMGVAFLGALAVPAARSFFALALLPAVQWLTIGLIAAAGGAALVVLTVAVRRALRG
jgi:magnesium-transporting ATPase (P-type)